MNWVKAQERLPESRNRLYLVVTTKPRHDINIKCDDEEHAECSGWGTGDIRAYSIALYDGDGKWRDIPKRHIVIAWCLIEVIRW